MNTPNALAAALGAHLPDGITIPADTDPARHVDAAEIRADQIAERLGALIPRRWANATVTHVEVAAWADRVVAGDTGSLLLVGQVGRGKSHQAYGAIRRIVESAWPRSLTIVAGPVTDLLDAVRPPCPDPREVVRSYREADLLLLDDVGVEDDSKVFVAEKLYQIIDYRYRYLLPTIVISNLPPSSREVSARTLATHLGDRLYSRLCEMCQLVVITGPDRRKAAR